MYLRLDPKAIYYILSDMHDRDYRDMNTMAEVKKVFKKDQTHSIILLVLILLIPFMVLLVREGVRYFIGAQANTPAFSFSPSTINLPQNSTVKLFLDAKNQKIGFTSFELRFDNRKVKLTGDIVTSNKLKSVIQKTSATEANNTGRARIVIGLHIDDRGNPPSGVFEVAQMSFVSLVDDPTSTLSISDSNFQVINTSAVALQTQTAEALITNSNNPPGTTTPPPGGGGSNLLVDPSFEGKIADNYSNHGQASYSQATDQVHGGSKSLKIVSTQSSSSALTRWFSKNGLIKAKAGARYEATVWVKTKDVASKAVLTLNFWGPGAYDDLSGASSSSVSGTKDWQKVTISTVSPSKTNYARLEMRLYGKGTVWFDDGSIIEK